MPKKSGNPLISAIFCHILQFCGNHKMNSTVDSTLRFCVPYLLMVFFWFQKYFSRIFAHKIANSKNSHFRANFLSNLHVKFWWEIAGTKNCRRALKFWHDLSLMLDRILQCTPSEFLKKVEIRPTLFNIVLEFVINSVTCKEENSWEELGPQNCMSIWD